MLRSHTIVIERDGRDKGKSFTITEMPAAQAEEWFMRAMLMLARSGADVPADIFQHGSAAFATMGIGALLTGLSKVPWLELRPLLEDMMGCVAFVSPAGIAISSPIQVNSQIEEISTRLQLREEVLSLHLGFSLAAKLSELRAMAARMIIDSSITETSPAPSAL